MNPQKISATAHPLATLPASHTQAGFTLVEIMVGLVIGMLVSIVIVQVLSTFDAQKNTTTGTADAQTNGSIALFSMGRDIQQAGFALLPVTDSPLECTTITFGGTGITSISPITIVNGVAAANLSASDSITILYGTSPSGGIPTRITAAPVINDVPVQTNFGCASQDVSLIINGSTCAISRVSALTGTTTVTLDNTTAAISGANLACLGAWNTVTYAINNGNLERNGQASMSEIVNLQAQYGLSAAGLPGSDPNFNQVTQWVNAKNLADWVVAVDGASTGVDWGSNMTLPAAYASRNRIKAIRMAVVARSPKMEPTAVTTACNSLTAPQPTGLCAWAGSDSSPAPAIDLSAGDPNWLRYRYRVFDTIIPLRNVIWSKDTL